MLICLGLLVGVRLFHRCLPSALLVGCSFSKLPKVVVSGWPIAVAEAWHWAGLVTGSRHFPPWLCCVCSFFQ